MIKITKWGIRKRVVVLTVTPVLTITGILSAYFVSSRIDDVRETLQARGMALAKHLATASEYALLTDNLDLLQSLADAANTEPDVIRVVIAGASSSNLVVSQDSNTASAQGPLKTQTSSLDNLVFSEAIQTKGFTVFDYESDVSVADKNTSSVIGYVTIVLSQTSSSLRKQEIVYGSVIIVLVGLVFSLLTALLFGSSVTQPIINLTRMGEKLRRGVLNARVVNESGGEVGELEKTFNDMASVMETSRDNMLEKIESATEELRTTVSQLEKKNQELDDARQEAELAGKVKSDFLAKMSHEIRTPMNAVIGFAQLLKNTQQDDAQQEYTRTIEQSAMQLLGILDDILNYSKLESGTIEMECVEFDVQRCLEDVICMLAPAAHKKNLELVLLVHSDIPQRVLGDPARICQVLTNLVNNAIKFTDSGSVTVQVFRQSGDEACCKLRIEVKDTGIGIQPSKVNDLFNEFVQADTSVTRRFGGTGLGLTIAKRFVSLMGGDIGVDSTYGSGSNFWFSFPVKEHLRQRQIEESSFPAYKFLIVDSHAQSRRAIRNNLLRWGATVFTFADIENAIKSINRNEMRKYFDILIWGLNKQEFGCVDPNILLSINREFSLPILALIGSEEPNLLLPELKCPNYYFMRKPFRRDTLYNSICRLLVLESQCDTQLTPDIYPPADTKNELVAKRVLVVEDNEFNRLLIKTLLNQWGADVVVATNGKQAIEEANQNQFDVILMDIHMPKTNGIVATETIRKKNGCNQNTPIIALTADVFVKERDKLLIHGFSDILLKPIVDEKLLDAIVNNLSKSSSNEASENSQSLQKPDQQQSVKPVMLPQLLIERYYKEISIQLAALIKAYESKDYDLVVHCAHVIHGLSGYFDQTDFVEGARVLEVAARSKEEDLSQYIGRLNQLYEDKFKQGDKEPVGV